MTDTGYDPAAAITEKLKDMTADEAVKMVRELCAQLGGDAEGFHGNIWPDNVRLDWEGRAVLGKPSNDPPNRREAEQVEYLAPEYFWESEASAAADVYSLGLLLYAACNDGYLPFQPKGGLMTVKDRSGALRRRMKGDPIPALAGVTNALADVIKKALAYEPEDRYISAAEFMRALGETDEALPAQPPAEEPDPPAGGETDPEECGADGAGEGAEPEEAAAPEAGSPAAGAIDPVEEQTAEPEAEISAAEVIDPKPEEAPAPGQSLEDVLNEDLSFQDLPDAAGTKAAGSVSDTVEQAQPAYTVQKDFEKKRDRRDYVPAANRKKRVSPVIPILCVAAVAVIAAAIAMQQRGQKAAEPAVEAVEEPTVIYTVDPSEATPPPEPVEVTPSLGDDEYEDAEAEPGDESAGDAEAEDTEAEPVEDIVRIADTGANLRTGPGTNYGVYETLPRGTELTRTGTVNGWSRVRYDGEEYYIASNLVTVVEQSEPEDGHAGSAVETVSGPTDYIGTLVVAKDVNIRSGPGTEYDKIGEAKVGAVLSAVGRSADGKWYLVATADGEGYVNRKLISVRDFAQVTDQSGTLTVTGEVNLRSGPATGYDILGIARVGEKLTLTGTTDTGWYRVSFNGKTAYLAGNFAALEP